MLSTFNTDTLCIMLNIHGKSTSNMYVILLSGKIGVANHVYNIIPENASSADDVDAADRANQWQVSCC